LGNVFIIATWLKFKEKRKYPDRIVLYFSICVLIVSLNGVLQSFMSKERVTCEDKFTFLEVKNSFLCGFLGNFFHFPGFLRTGMLLQFGAAGTLGWWLCIVISTWVKNHHFSLF
jgi:hypothetical protein